MEAWKTILVGFVVLTIVKYIGGVVLLLENGIGANTENQAALEQLGMSPLLLVVLTAIAAPIVEETVMRGLILGRLFNNSYLGVILSSLLFGLLHIQLILEVGLFMVVWDWYLLLFIIRHRNWNIQ